MPECWLISIPKSSDDKSGNNVLKTIDNATKKQQYYHHGLSENCSIFEVPKFQVCGLNRLITLADRINTLDSVFEQNVRKVGHCYREIYDEVKIVPGSDFELTATSISPNPDDVSGYLTRFQWDEDKYPSSDTFDMILTSIDNTVVNLDAELKKEMEDYRNIKSIFLMFCYMFGY